jgi:hypothetical protein
MPSTGLRASMAIEDLGQHFQTTIVRPRLKAAANGRLRSALRRPLRALSLAPSSVRCGSPIQCGVAGGRSQLGQRLAISGIPRRDL